MLKKKCSISCYILGPPVPPRRSSDPTSPGEDEDSPLVTHMGPGDASSPQAQDSHSLLYRCVF